ncbi:MAG TPA: hypothetical protein VHB02_12645 [Acidimicrobiales bacterium]|nr:hypothetical protein [Acidimicrobiales bacterium]
MVSAGTAGRILSVVAAALPEEGEDVLTGLRIHEGWGGTVQVTIYTGLHPVTEAAEAFARRIRAAAANLPRRHELRLSWDPGPSPTDARAGSGG